MVHSNAIIEESLDRIIEAIANYDDRASWDPNYGNGYMVKPLTEESEVHYIRTKRVAMVAPRD